MSSPSFSIEAAVRFGWDAARKNLKLFAPLVLIGFFINSLRSALLTPSGAAYVYRQLVARAASGVTTAAPEELPKGFPTPA